MEPSKRVTAAHAETPMHRSPGSRSRAWRTPATALLFVIGCSHPNLASAAHVPRFAAPFVHVDFPASTGITQRIDSDFDGRDDLSLYGLGYLLHVLFRDSDGVPGISGDEPVAVIGQGLLADLDDDGRLDAVAIGQVSSYETITAFMRQPDGSYGVRQDLAIGASAYALAAADLDGDHRVDVVTMGSAVRILRGHGDGTFEVSQAYAIAPSYFWGAAIGDLNGDGRPDLVFVGTTGTSGPYPPYVPSVVSVRLGNGDGTFGEPEKIIVETDARQVKLADLNMDGHLDVVLGLSRGMGRLLGNGDGTFGPPTLYSMGDLGSHIVIADFNRDGRPDVATAALSGNLVLWSGDGWGGFSPMRTAATKCRPYELAAADFNDDGIVDLATWQVPEGGVALHFGNGDATFGKFRSLQLSSGPYGLVLGDFSLDGKLDIALACSNSRVALLRNQVGGQFAAPIEAPVNYPQTIAAGDLDANGSLDLVLGADYVAVFATDGFSFGTRVDVPFGREPVEIVPADLIEDGRLELAVIQNWSASMGVLILRNQPPFTISVHAEIPTSTTGARPVALAIGDLDRDDHLDLVAANNDGTVAILRGHGDGSFDPPATYSTGSSGAGRLALGDLNGDGALDVVAIRGLYVAVLLNRGDGSLGPPTSYRTGSQPIHVAIGDLNGDGFADLAVGNGGDYTVSVLEGRGDGTFETKIDVGVGDIPYQVAIGDLDGDGRADLVATGFNRNAALLLINTTPNTPTATELALFTAEPLLAGIELRWQLVDARRFDAVTLERAPAATGPWNAIEGETRVESGITVRIDATAEPGRSYSYQLVGTRAGERVILGSVDGARMTVLELALRPVVPTPARGIATLGFTVARETHVRLSVLDVTGRRVALLADGMRAPGAHEIAWSGEGEGGRVPAGLYFARLEAAGQTLTRRLVYTR